MYKSYARLYLDYAFIIYFPHHLQLIDTIERVQRNFTKRLYGLRQFSYVERLRALDLESLELHRIRNDLVTLYKLLHGRIASSVFKAFKCNNVRGTRGHFHFCYNDCVENIITSVIELLLSRSEVSTLCKLLAFKAQHYRYTRQYKYVIMTSFNRM